MAAVQSLLIRFLSPEEGVINSMARIYSFSQEVIAEELSRMESADEMMLPENAEDEADFADETEPEESSPPASKQEEKTFIERLYDRWEIW